MASALTTGLVPPEAFFQLVDKVLVAVGRQPLPPESSQRAIVEVRPGDRVLQILAGPGSGKTEMLVWRVLYQLFVLGTASHRILVTTFTKRAATDLSIRLVERSDEFLVQARAMGMLPADPHVHDLRIGTVHSQCDSLLAEFDVGYMEAGTEVVDDVETRVRLARDFRFALGYGGPAGAQRLVDRLLGCDELVSLFRPPWDEGRWPSSTFDRVDLLLALLAQHTETWMPRCAAESKANGIETGMGIPGLTADLILLQKRWSEYLDSRSILDFATLQERFCSRQAEILEHVDHVFVDEFQDTNPIQLAIHIGWLKRSETRLTVVGDDDQSVYRFRGSDIGCFTGLATTCNERGVPMRLEKLEGNWRSSKRIVAFTEAFRQATVLSDLSMEKSIRPGSDAAVGPSVRLIQGPWADLCALVAEEISLTGAGRPGGAGEVPPTVAVLMFSTSEKESRAHGAQPALTLRRALALAGLRVYNPRNKTAAQLGSPIFELAALLSYFFDPVSKAPAGIRGRVVEVNASMPDRVRGRFARTVQPPFRITDAHAGLQKAFIKQDGDIVAPGPASIDLLRYLDQIRENLIGAIQRGGRPRLTISGLVARLLTFPRFRNVGFTAKLFREAMFTQLIEANIAPTRLSTSSLDNPLQPAQVAGKVGWPDEVWTFLNVFGSLIRETSLDDPDVEELAEDAVSLLTFHQAKGLEFDRVYVALTGRGVASHAPLRTALFSGESVPYTVDPDGQPRTSDRHTLELALADREREVYVALTRARSDLTVICDPNHDGPMSGLNPGIETVFSSCGDQARGLGPALTLREFHDV